MDQKKKNDLMDYISIPLRWTLYGALITTGIVVVLAVAFFIYKRDLQALYAGAALLVIVLLVFACVYFWRRSTAQALLTRLSRKGVLNLVVEDFAESIPVSSNCLRIGKDYVYAHGLPLITSMKDISTLTVRYLYTGNKYAKQPRLVAIDVTGAKHDLCDLPMHSPNPALQEIYNVLIERIPHLLTK